MKKILCVLISFFFNCKSKNELVLLASLPKQLKEVSGVEKLKGSDLLWMHNDSGSKSYIYGVDVSGNIVRKVAVKEKNTDWEDVTSDEEGNLYIGDFGNNENKRKNLVILKVKNKDLLNKDKVKAVKIKFSYPDQYEFPPKKDQFFFDAEAFFYVNNYLYLFTKSDVKNEYGKTKLYKVPANKGKYEAEFVSEFNAGKTSDFRITAASISPNKKKVALLTHNKILLFTNYSSDDFFKGDLTQIDLKHTSQKEGITFKNNTTLYVTDEKAKSIGGDLYSYKLN